MSLSADFQGKGQLAALAWLDLHLAINRLRSIARNPRRLIPWLVVLAWFGLSLFGRFAFSRHGQPFTGSGLGQAVGRFSVLAPGLSFAALGWCVWRGATRAPVSFKSPADGVFLIIGGFPSRLVLTWLAVRTLRGTAFIALFYTALLVATPLGLSTARSVLGAVGLAFLFGCLFACGLAAFSAGRRVSAAVPRLVGIVMVAVGALSVGPALIVLAGSDSTSALGSFRFLFDLPPGAWVVSAFSGSLVAVVLLAGASVLLATVGVVFAGDCYPEIWATSTRVFVVRRVMRESGGLMAYGQMRRALREANLSKKPEVVSRRSEIGRGVPGGAWTLAWKEWVMVKRTGGGIRMHAAVVVAAFAAGLVLGLATAHSRLGFILAVEVPFFWIFFTGLRSIQLAHDLRSPLWWLSPSPVWARLLVWTLTRAIRYSLPVSAFLAAYLVAQGRSASDEVGAIVLCVVASWLMQIVGIATYSLPALSDRRLTQMIRFLAISAFLIPVGVAAALGAVVEETLHLRFLSLFVIAAIIAAEAAGTLSFASWRIENNGLAIAREESQ
jgi:hypothetical protein